MAPVVATRVTIYLSEDDRSDGRSLHKALIERARQSGLAGATVWKGVEGFGPSRRIRSARFPDAGFGLPLALELIDQPDRIEHFLQDVRDIAPGALVTTEVVHATRTGQNPPP